MGMSAKQQKAIADYLANATAHTPQDLERLPEWLRLLELQRMHLERMRELYWNTPYLARLYIPPAIRQILERDEAEMIGLEQP